MLGLASLVAVLVITSSINAEDDDSFTGIEWEEIQEEDFGGLRKAIGKCVKEDQRARKVLHGYEGSLLGIIRTLVTYKSVEDQTCFRFGQFIESGGCAYKDTICGIKVKRIPWKDIPEEDFHHLLKSFRKTLKHKGKDKPRKILNGMRAEVKTKNNKYHLTVMNYENEAKGICNVYHQINNRNYYGAVACSPKNFHG